MYGKTIYFLLHYLVREIISTCFKLHWIVHSFLEIVSRNYITDSEAERLLLTNPKTNEDQDHFNEVTIWNSRVWHGIILFYIHFQDTASALPLNLDRSALRAIDPDHVLIVKRRSHANSKFIFYRNILPDLQKPIRECLLVKVSFYEYLKVKLLNFLMFSRYSMLDWAPGVTKKLLFLLTNTGWESIWRVLISKNNYMYNKLWIVFILTSLYF